MSDKERASMLAIKHDPEAQVSVGFDPDAGKFVGYIRHGLSNRYRTIMHTGPLYDTAEEARQEMETTLERIKGT
jgi:hypothetical protein